METYNSNNTRKKKGKGCAVGCLAVLVIMLGIGALIAFSWGLMVDSFLDDFREGADARAMSREYGVDEVPRMREIWSYGKADADIKVLRLMLRGMLLSSDIPWDTDGVGSASSAIQAIRRAKNDPKIKAILLELDTPGGGITISDQVYHALKDFKSSTAERVVVAHMGDICASGGYYIALAADHIIAHPTTVTGSIGVLIPGFNVKELADKIGLRDVTIRSGSNKDMLNPLRDLDPAQTNLVQAVVDSLYDHFVGLVAENRELPREQVTKLADGRIFLAKEALDGGLIDSIGYREDAMATVEEMLGSTDKPQYIRYEDDSSWRAILRRLRFLGHGGSWRSLLGNHNARFMYLFSKD